MKQSSRVAIGYLLAIAGLGGLLYGVDFGVIAAASPYIKALQLFTDAELSWIVGAVLFGGIVIVVRSIDSINELGHALNFNIHYLRPTRRNE